MQTQTGGGRIVPTPIAPSAREGVGGQHLAPAALVPGKTRYPFYRRLGGPRAGLDGPGKSRLHHDSFPRPSRPYRIDVATMLS